MVIDFDQERAGEYNRAYVSLASELGIDYLDIHTPLLQDAEYMAGLPRGDRTHCDRRGYEIMTELIQALSSWDAWFPLLSNRKSAEDVLTLARRTSGPESERDRIRRRDKVESWSSERIRPNPFVRRGHPPHPRTAESG